MHKDSDRDPPVNMFERTSVTVDEAVFMLLGWTHGPLYCSSCDGDLTDAQKKIRDSQNTETYPLWAGIDTIRFELEQEYKDAKRRKRPAPVIAELRAAMEKLPDEVRQAKAYLCAIKDELNEGDSSALRIDKELSSGAVRFITRSSFVRWAQDCFDISLATPIPQPKGTPAPQELRPVGVKEASQGSNQKLPARQRLRAQEQAILDAIAGLEWNPKCLQRNVGRQHGAKYLLRTKLKGHALFPSQRVFDKAWERMLGSDIAYAEEEVSSP